MKLRFPLMASALMAMASCAEDEQKFAEQSADFKMKGTDKAREVSATSKTPNLLKLTSAFEDKNVKIYPILSSEDRIPNTSIPEQDFIYGSMADGAGLLRNEDNTYYLINNIEADYSVARIHLDENLEPLSGEYILNAMATANTAQCSGTLITPEEHGFGPLYLSGGEWGGSSQGVFKLDPLKDASEASMAEMADLLGQWSTENAVAIGKDAYPGKTVIIVGDDDSNSSVPSGHLGVYVSTTGDLNNGKLYSIKVTDENVSYEMDMAEGESYPVEFVELVESGVSALDAEAKAKGVMGFTRVEDIDWRRGSAKNNREIYFCVTGRSSSALAGKGTKYGRVYKLELNENDPLGGAKITCVLDGDNLEGIAKTFHSPDNIVVTKNYAYIQEDPNGYFDAPEKQHYARLYQYHIPSGKLETVLECDQEFAASLGYGSTNRTWEITGMVDVSETTGLNKTFLVMTQNHGWTDPSFTDPTANPSPSSSEGSVLYVVQGLQR